jgi:modulator of FtsH protease
MEGEVSAIPGWSDFFVAAAGVAGALAGLVFVSLSINLERILKLPSAIGRAGETLFVLAGVLAVALISIVPAQSARHLGVILLFAAIPVWFLPMLTQLRTYRQRQYQHVAQVLLRAALHQFAMLPIVLGALGLVGAIDGFGISGVAAGCIIAMLVAMFSAWVLLVEILR